MRDLHSESLSSTPVGRPARFSEIRIENTNLCNYRCHFCPRDHLTRSIGIMPLDDLHLVMKRVGTFDGQVDLHGFGEPLLDPNLIARTRLVAERWPKATLRLYSTLGVKVRDGFFEALFGAGMAQLHVSLYGYDDHSYRVTHGVNRFALAVQNLDALLEAARKTGGRGRVILRANPFSECAEAGWDHAAEIAMREKVRARGAETLERALHNYGNGRAYNPPGRGRTCSVVWGYRREILQIDWELNVVPCCFDFNSSVVIGNLRHASLDEIFSSPTYSHFMAAHRDDELSAYPVCDSCERCGKTGAG